MNTQKEITTWANETFGKNSLWYLYHRLHMEYSELRHVVNNGSSSGSYKEEQEIQMADELADIHIVIVQIAEKLQFNLMERVSMKMEKNMARKWAWHPEDGIWKHVK